MPALRLRRRARGRGAKCLDCVGDGYDRNLLEQWDRHHDAGEVSGVANNYFGALRMLPPPTPLSAQYTKVESTAAAIAIEPPIRVVETGLIPNRQRPLRESAQ